MPVPQELWEMSIQYLRCNCAGIMLVILQQQVLRALQRLKPLILRAYRKAFICAEIRQG
jgi:hypothetical protein